jgi:hypothetical protein
MENLHMLLVDTGRWRVMESSATHHLMGVRKV